MALSLLSQMLALMKGPPHPKQAHPPRLISPKPAAPPKRGSQPLLRLLTATTQLLLAVLVLPTVQAILLLLSQVSLCILLCQPYIGLSTSMSVSKSLGVSIGLTIGIGMRTLLTSA